MALFVNTLIITSLFGTLVTADSKKLNIDIPSQISNTSSHSPGYSALRLLLDDEQYLTTIRRTKMIFTFSSISDNSIELIDNIAESSEQAIDNLDELAQKRPVIAFVDFSEKAITKATFDSLRMATAKEFIFGGENFEKDLLLSQLSILRLISHIAAQLEEVEPNEKRSLWLSKLSKQYEAYYQQVNMRISIKGQS
ncbi:hypothetical protein MNBD_GAMMA05-703 [hydrothermal vent metagenome]|uniref:Uncharacterized protein n=1 Tax=hydrothermal vent metagenome TaxID=652676 RepID=A0A3B0X8R6_9ZZZZ